MKLLRLGLLPRVIVAIILGVTLGGILTTPWVRILSTFDYIFGQFLNFMVPLIVVGLVTPAIIDSGRSAKRILGVTVVMAYADTVLASMIGYGVGSFLFPDMVNGCDVSGLVDGSDSVPTYFTLNIPPMMDVLSALVLSFVAGLSAAYTPAPTMRGLFLELKTVIHDVIRKVIVPCLPIYVFGIFLTMTFTGAVYGILHTFAQVVVVIFALHIFVLTYLFCLAGIVTRRNPLKLIRHMLPAYFTALGTSSSSATIPVTLAQAHEAGVKANIAGFTIPLCAAIHMPGSAMKITSCALAVCMIWGMPHDALHFLHFVMLLGVMMMAAPGVPGATVLAAIAPMSSVLGFGDDQNALMISLFVAMDSFGTACNVTGDGALALMIDKITSQKVEAVE